MQHKVSPMPSCHWWPWRLHLSMTSQCQATPFQLSPHAFQRTVAELWHPFHQRSLRTIRLAPLQPPLSRISRIYHFSFHIHANSNRSTYVNVSQESHDANNVNLKEIIEADHMCFLPESDVVGKILDNLRNNQKSTANRSVFLRQIYVDCTRGDQRGWDEPNS